MEILPVQVCLSAAGYYIGRMYIEDGIRMPYSRLSGYYRQSDDDQDELKTATQHLIDCEWRSKNGFPFMSWYHLDRNGSDILQDFIPDERPEDTADRLDPHHDGFGI